MAHSAVKYDPLELKGSLASIGNPVLPELCRPHVKDTESSRSQGAPSGFGTRIQKITEILAKAPTKQAQPLATSLGEPHGGVVSPPLSIFQGRGGQSFLIHESNRKFNRLDLSKSSQHVSSMKLWALSLCAQHNQDTVL